MPPRCPTRLPAAFPGRVGEGALLTVTHDSPLRRADVTRREMSTATDNPIRNGVDTATLLATLDAVKGNSDIAKFQFRASNKWVSGTHSKGTISGFYGAGQEMEHKNVHVFDVDHPAVL